MKNTSLILPAVAVLAIAAGSEAVLAQTAEQTAIDTFLYDFYYYDLETEFVELGTPAFGTAVAGGDGVLEHNFVVGTRYVAAAKCEERCTDIDIYVIDGNGIIMAEDTAEEYAGDNFARIDFTSEYDQPMWIRVVVTECAGDPCLFGLGLYSAATP